ncbi:MAG: cyclic nucleotide-binding domain-containing protein [Hyphomicrobiaceae bacterium]
MAKLLEHEVEALRRVPLFASVEPIKLKLLAFASERIEFSAGQDLMRQGEHGDAAYVMLSGEAEVLVSSGDVETRVATLTGNEFIGEISILCGVPRTATVRAITPVETLRIDKDQFFELVENAPSIAVQMMRILAERLAKTTAEMSAMRAGNS